jgi:hypothetical protein
MKVITCLCGTVACLVAAVAALNLSTAEYSYRESVHQDGSEMYMLCLECPQTDYVPGCGTRAALMDSHFFYKDKGHSYTSRAARLYGAPDSVNHLSGQGSPEDRRALSLPIRQKKDTRGRTSTTSGIEASAATGNSDSYRSELIESSADASQLRKSKVSQKLEQYALLLKAKSRRE